MDRKSSRLSGQNDYQWVISNDLPTKNACFEEGTYINGDDLWNIN